MPGIPKIVTFTPLVRPEARSSPSPSPKHDLRLVPQKAPKTSVSPALHELFWRPQTSETDVWAHFSNSEGFHDENGFYYPPMDPEEIRQFAEKYFSSPEFYSSPSIEFDQDLLSDLDQDSLISDLVSESNAGYSSNPQLDFLNEHLNSTFPSSDLEEQLDLFLSDTLWPLPLDTTTTEAPASGDTLLADESLSDVDMAMDTSI